MTVKPPPALNVMTPFSKYMDADTNHYVFSKQRNLSAFGLMTSFYLLHVLRAKESECIWGESVSANNSFIRLSIYISILSSCLAV